MLRRLRALKAPGFSTRRAGRPKFRGLSLSAGGWRFRDSLDAGRGHGPSLRRPLAAFVALALCFCCATVCAADGEGAVSVQFERFYENDLEYAVLTARDAAGNERWSRTTGSYECAQLDRVCEIAANGDAYYYCEDGAIIALNLADGAERWRNSDFGGSASGFAFGEDGTLYVCGYFGPDFFAVDAEGNALARIDALNSDVYWPYEMRYLGDRVAITYEGSNDLGSDVVLCVRLSDYSPDEGDIADAGSDIPFDEKIQHIRAAYYDTQEHLSEYAREDGDGGLVYYFDGDELKKIVAPAGTYAGERDGAEDYAAEYYYENGGQLIFAFVFQKSEEYRFYIWEGECIRWIDDAGNVTDWQDGVNIGTDFGTNSDFCQFGYMEPHWADLW